MVLTWSLAAVPVLIALNAFFVASEYAVVAVRPAQIAALRSRKANRAADAIERLKSDPASAIGAIQVCITMTNLLLGWIGEPAMSAVLHRLLAPLVRMYPVVFDWVALGLSFIVVTLLTVVFSELLPKALTLRHAGFVAVMTAVPVLALQRAIFPLVWLMNAIANLATVPLGLGRVEAMEQQRVTPDELMVMANEAAAGGTVSARERSVILSALTLDRRRAREIMVPRVQVAYLDLRRSMDDNRQIMGQYLHTRMPLCEGGMDKAIGVVNTKEFLATYHAEADVSVLRLLVKPPVFVPHSVTLDRLLTTFLDQKIEMVFLVDEHGGVEGIVTLRDVVDELVGEATETQAAV